MSSPNTVSPLVYAFDLGKASLGVCVRQGQEVKHLNSLLLDADYGSNNEARKLNTRRRVCRTHKAHTERERALRQRWQQAGLALLPTGDARWHQEFDPTGQQWHNGVQLRMALQLGLPNPNGTPLEDWQLFKALHSAMQRRGYDENVAWANSTKEEKQAQQEAKAAKQKETENQATDDTDTAENKEGLARYQTLLSDYGLEDEASPYRLPCFLEGSLLGLWQASNPTKVQLKLGATASKVRQKGLVAPRHLVAAELTTLWQTLQTLRPVLQQWPAEVLLYGPSGIEYASCLAGDKKKAEGLPAAFKRFAKFRGSNRTLPGSTIPFDWEGLLGQKVPRFDNRIIGKCQLFPHLNVCRSHTPIAQEVKLLLALKNLRYPTTTLEQAALEPHELKAVWQAFEQEEQKEITTAWLNKKLPELLPFKALKVKDHKKTYEHFAKRTKDSGRSRYCRPALYLLRDLMLSGESPNEFVESLLAQGVYIKNAEGERTPFALNAQKGITRQHLEEVLHLQRLGRGDTWGGLSPQDNRYAAETFIYNEPAKQQAIARLIGSVNNPVVRHRVQWFYNTFRKLEALYGPANTIVLEFVRGEAAIEGSKTSKIDYEKHIKAQAKENEEATAHLKEKGLPATGFNIKKYKLWKQQEGRCLYSGELIDLSQRLEVDHMVPVSAGATNALYNLALVKAEENQKKGNRTVYEYMISGNSAWDWDAFKGFVDGLKHLPKRKKEVALCTNRDKAVELMERWQGLAETGWVARMAQQVLALHLGQGLQVAGAKRKVFVANGSQTAAFRAQYGLNDLLLNDEERHTLEELRQRKSQHEVLTDEERKTLEGLEKKKRDNPKHHALDAYVISFSQEATEVKRRHPHSEEERCLRDYDYWTIKSTLEQHLAHVIPAKQARNKAKLDFEETYYGLREGKDAKGNAEYYVIKRVSLVDDKGKLAKPDSLLDKALSNALQQALKEQGENTVVASITAGSFRHPNFGTPVKKAYKVVSTAAANDLRWDKNGRLWVGEYCNVSKQLSDNLQHVQLKRTAGNTGQLIYFDAKGKPQVQPLYPHESPTLIKQRLAEKGFALYRNGEMYHSGGWIEVDHPIDPEKKNLPAGRYQITTVRVDGVVGVQTPNGDSYLTSAAHLIQAGMRCYVPPSF
jgi:CRISPR-associated endonuclease Csn1